MSRKFAQQQHQIQTQPPQRSQQQPQLQTQPQQQIRKIKVIENKEDNEDVQLKSSNQFKAINELNITDNDTRKCILNLLNTKTKFTSNDKLISHFKKHKGVRRKEPIFNANKIERKLKKIPNAPTELQPKELHGKLNELEVDPSFDEIANKQKYNSIENKIDDNYEVKLKDASILSNSEVKLKKKKRVTFDNKVKIHKVESNIPVRVHETAGRIFDSVNNISISNANTTRGKIIINKKNVTNYGNLKSTKNKIKIRKFNGNSSKAEMIRNHCNNHLYYIDKVKDKLYVIQGDIDKYGIKLKPYIDYKLMLNKHTNITMYQLWMIFIYYIKIKCSDDSRAFNNDKFVKDNELLPKLLVILDDYKYAAEIELINEIHKQLHYVPVKRHRKTKYWCNCNYYDKKLNDDFDENITKNFGKVSKPKVLQLNAIKKVDEFTYELNDESGPEMYFYESILSQPINEIRKNTCDFAIYGEPYKVKGFEDGGASLDCAGSDYLKIFGKYIDKSIRQTVVAGGFDSGATKRYHKSNTKLKLPIEVHKFKVKPGESEPEREFLHVWIFDCIPNDMLILGQNGRRMVELGTFSRNDIKKIVYTMHNGLLFNSLPEDEVIDGFLDDIEYRNKGRPGIYKITEDQDVVQYGVRFAAKNEFENALKNKNCINVINLYELTDDENVLKYVDNCIINDLVQLKNGNYVTNKIGNEGIIYTIDDTIIENYISNESNIKMKNNDDYVIEQVNSIELNQSVNTAVFELKNDTLSNGDTISYPTMLDDLNMKEPYSKDEILLYKKKLSTKSNVFARSDFHGGCIKNYEPFHVHVKDINKCTIGGCKRLSPADQKIMQYEVEEYIENGYCEWQDQSRADHVVLHTTNTFIVHRSLWDDKKGTFIVKSRAVNDYVPLNANTYEYIYDNYTMDDIHEQLAGCMMQNSADIKKYFYQLLAAQQAKKFIALRIPYAGGILICNRVMQGLMNAPIRAHEIASKIFDCIALVLQDDLNQGIWADNIEAGKLIAMDLMELLIDVCLSANLKLHVKKLFVGQTHYDRFNRFITPAGHGPLVRHTTKALCIDYKDLKTKTDFMSFVGMCNAIEQYIPNLAHLIQLLKNEILETAELPSKEINGVKLTIKQRNKLTRLRKTEAGRKIFNEINDAIKNALLLHTPDTSIKSKHRFLGIIDTSLYKTGGILCQQKLSKPPFKLSRDPIIFEEQFKNGYNIVQVYSKRLSGTQTRYGASARELLGVKMFFRKFRRYLIIKPFDIIADCKPLIPIFTLNRDSPNAKFIRWRTEMCHYRADWWHRDGNRMRFPDYASRLMYETDGQCDDTINPSREEINIIEFDSNMVYEEVNNLILMVQYLSSDVSKTTESMDRHDKEYDMNEINDLKNIIENDVQKALNESTPLESINNISISAVDKFENEIDITKHMNIIDTSIIDMRNKISNATVLPYYVNQIRRIYNIFTNDNVIYKNRFDKLIELENLRIGHNQLLETVNELKSVRVNNLCDEYSIILNDINIINDYVNKNNDLNIAVLNNINTVMTRAKARALKDKLENKKNIEIVDLRDLEFDDNQLAKFIDEENKLFASDPTLEPFVRENKYYYHKPLKENPFINSNISIINMVKNEQKRVYGNLIRKLKDSSYVVNIVNEFDKHYVRLLNDNMIDLRDDGVIIYNGKQIIMPPGLRIGFIQICHVLLQHRGIDQTFNYIKKLIYIPNLQKDVAFYVKRCPCQIFNKKNRNRYNKDKGPMKVSTVSRNNQKVFQDLFGPMHDGFHLSIMIDLFDDWLDIQVVQPTSLDIIKKVLFKWNYTEGIIERLYNDRGSYYTSKLVKVYKYIVGTSNLNLIEYNPWINYAETQMKAVNKGLSINKYGYDNFLVNNLYMKLLSLNEDKKYMNYRDYVDSIKFAHNMQISPKTGYTAFEMRRSYPYYSSMLELGLRLHRGKNIDINEYCTNGIVDYDEFVKLLKNNYDLSFKDAVKNRIKYETKIQLAYNDIPSNTYKINDYVLFQPTDNIINKHITNELYGWVVKKVLIPGKMYTIQNIFDKRDIIDNVSHGHLRPFYKPIWVDPLLALDGKLLRIDKMERKEEENEFKEFLGDELDVDEVDLDKLEAENLNFKDINILKRIFNINENLNLTYLYYNK